MVLVLLQIQNIVILFKASIQLRLHLKIMAVQKVMKLVFIINGDATGISEAFVNQQLLIYPNPGFGMFKIRFDLGREHDIRYDVVNSNGKLLSTSGLERVSSGEYLVNLIAQSTGYYFIRFYVDDIVVTKKLLKTN